MLIFRAWATCEIRRQPGMLSVLTKRAINSMKTGQFILNSQIYAQRVPPRIACEQALIFGQVKRVSRERASERRSREANFACPNRRACSQATPRIHRCAGILEMPGSQAHRERLRVTAPSVNRFRLEKQQLWKCITLFRRFLNRHCTTATGEVSNFQVYGERKHKATIFFFLFWT